MIQTRVIPILLINNQGLYKGIKFKNKKYVGDPINAVKIFNEKEVDELIVLDIDATKENRAPNFKMIEDLAVECRMPLCYGGGIKTVEQAKKIIKLGAEKIALSSIIFENRNRIKEIAYRGTEKKTLACNAIIKFKLGNPVKIYINFLSPVRSLYLNKTFFRQLIDVAAGGKIKTKVKLSFQFNPNSCAYRSGKNHLLAFELSKNYSITKRLFTTRINSKSDYIDKSLTNDKKHSIIAQ